MLFPTALPFLLNRFKIDHDTRIRHRFLKIAEKIYIIHMITPVMPKTKSFIIICCIILLSVISASCTPISKERKATDINNKDNNNDNDNNNNNNNDNNNCTQYTTENCPSSCVICPPCPECSSISCRSEEYCKSIGFDRKWYESVRPE
jgi:hypothetical protein